MAKAKQPPRWYLGPDPESPTGWSNYDISTDAMYAEWYGAWETYLNEHPEKRAGDAPVQGSGPVPLDEHKQRKQADPYEGDPERKAAFAEAVAYIKDYAGTWGFILDLRAHRAWGTKHFRLSDRQVEVVLKSKARDAEHAKERTERKSSGLDLNVLPEGTTRYAVENAEGETTFIRVDRVTEDKWAGWVFVKQVIGGGAPGMENEQRLGSQRPGDGYKGSFERLLRKVLDDPLSAARRYGLELGTCSDCGRTLTNAESREYGIGPVCRGKWAA